MSASNITKLSNKETQIIYGGVDFSSSNSSNSTQESQYKDPLNPVGLFEAAYTFSVCKGWQIASFVSGVIVSLTAICCCIARKKK